MFSGIIEHTAPILSVWGWLFTVENTFKEALHVGQSIAHDGACMTLTDVKPESYSFFVMEESLRITNFWSKKAWDFFNIERSLKFSDRMDGHMVSGHIDTLGKIIHREVKWDNSLILKISFDKKYKNTIVRKGSITVNGVSLTIVEDLEDSLTISLIPLTQELTNLGNLCLWDHVNLEFDMIGKYVAKMLRDTY